MEPERLRKTTIEVMVEEQPADCACRGRMGSGGPVSQPPNKQQSDKLRNKIEEEKILEINFPFKWGNFRRCLSPIVKIGPDKDFVVVVALGWLSSIIQSNSLVVVEILLPYNNKPSESVFYFQRVF